MRGLPVLSLDARKPSVAVRVGTALVGVLLLLFTVAAVTVAAVVAVEPGR